MRSGHSTHGIADFTNSTSTGSGSDFNAEAPVRIADTRTGSGLPYSGHTLTIRVAGAGGRELHGLGGNQPDSGHDSTAVAGCWGRDVESGRGSGEGRQQAQALQSGQERRSMRVRPVQVQ